MDNGEHVWPGGLSVTIAEWLWPRGSERATQPRGPPRPQGPCPTRFPAMGPPTGHQAQAGPPGGLSHRRERPRSPSESEQGTRAHALLVTVFFQGSRMPGSRELGLSQMNPDREEMETYDCI